MKNSTTNRNVFTAVTLILMFLLADVFVPSAFPAPEHLEEEPSVQHVISTTNPSLDTYIDSDYPNDDYAGEDTGLLGVSGTSEGRLLLSFPLNFAHTDTIHSARLDLVCTNSGPQRTGGVSCVNFSFMGRKRNMELTRWYHAVG